MNSRFTRSASALLVLAGAAALGSAADVVILKDGFVIQGHIRKESEAVFDKASGTTVRIVKANGLDMIDEGPKFTIFSTHAKQLGEISPEVKIRPDYKAYTMRFTGFRNPQSLSTVAQTLNTGEFNSKWVRVLTIKETTGAKNRLEQQITHLDPYFIYMASATHQWRLAYRTNEWDPKLVRKLLAMHPDLAEPDGKCDPDKRIAIAKFMLDAGWLQVAKDEVDKLGRDFVGALPKAAQEALDKLKKEIDQATAVLVVQEAETALAAGRYKYAAELLSVFPEKSAEPKEVARAAKVGADLKTGQERYDTARRLLGRLIDTVTDARAAAPFVGVGGGLARVAWRPAKPLSPESRELATAAAHVFGELHPDSAGRIELFVTLAVQDENQRKADKTPTMTPDRLLATAISGWTTGRAGATPDVAKALKLWDVRQHILEHQRTDTIAGRNRLLEQFKKSVNFDSPMKVGGPMKVEIPMIAQIISMLPPVDPENLENRTGKPVALGKGAPGGVYRRKSGPAPGFPLGVDYLVKLPPEYHHGRAYPVLIVLTTPGVDAEQVLAPLMTQSEKNGYIVIAPEWAGQFENVGWQWRGEDHVYVTAALRDTVRHFTVDNDRVFLCGVAEGANMAMDVGSSHPDLFAGVIPVSPIPKWQGQFIESWRNAQKLPFYIVTGEYAGQSLPNLKRILLNWMPHGFPAVVSIFKGRGAEWFATETPVIFDWMSRKKRVNGVATLALGTYREPWILLRESDNRFYWLEANDSAPGTSGGGLVPAKLQGNIRGNNFIDVSTFRVRRLTVWLSSDMIDWERPVRVQLNTRIPEGWNKPKKIEPSLDVLLEDYFERGDRRMLFLNKLEFSNIPN